MKRFEVGARVVEPTYGLGSVVAVEDAYTRVQFDEHGVKKFLTSMSQPRTERRAGPAGLRSGKPRKKRAPRKPRPLPPPPKIARRRCDPRPTASTTPTSPRPTATRLSSTATGCFWIASRKSPISLRLFTTLCARNRPPLSSRGKTRSKNRL